MKILTFNSIQKAVSLFGLIMLVSFSAYAQDPTIEVTRADNELYIIAVSDKGTASYELLHVKTGWWKKVNVKMTIKAGDFTKGFEKNAINDAQNNAVDINEPNVTLNLPKGKYAILICTIDWGVAGYSTVKVNGEEHVVDLKNSKNFNPMVTFPDGDNGNPIMIEVK